MIQTKSDCGQDNDWQQCNKKIVEEILVVNPALHLCATEGTRRYRAAENYQENKLGDNNFPDSLHIICTVAEAIVLYWYLTAWQSYRTPELRWGKTANTQAATTSAMKSGLVCERRKGKADA